MAIYINKDGRQSGPYEEHIVTDQLGSGVLSPDDLGIRHGESSWRRLGEMFPDIAKGAYEPFTGAAPPPMSVAAAAPAVKKGGGCLKFGLIGAGLLFLLLGIGVGVGSRFIPSVSCDLAESDANKIDKLKMDLDRAKKDGKFERIGPLQVQLDQELAGAPTSQQYCDEDKFRNNLIGGVGGALAVIGLLMALIGVFVVRRR
jgi:hypothetical protein